MKFYLKKILSPIWIWTVLFSVTSTDAQQTQGEHLSMTALVQKGQITLRWFPLTHTDWSDGRKMGYKLYRTPLNTDNAASVDLAKGLIKPMDAKQMETFFEGNNAGLLAARISQKEADPTDIASNDLYMAMAMQASAYSPLIAQTMGLIFTDTTALKASLYQYTLELPGVEKISVVVNTSDYTRLVAPDSLMPQYTNKTLTLKWRMTDSLSQMGYVVERSDDQAKTFKELNTAPVFVEDLPDQNGHYFALYVDTLQQWYKQYYYRVRAITPFGIRSEPSQLVGIYSYRDLVPSPEVKGTSVQAGNLLTWTYPDSLLTDIQGYKILRSDGIGNPYEVLTDTLLPINTKHWLDATPLNNSYYRVAAIDWGSDPHAGYPVFVQVDDSIPPLQPSFKSVLMLEGSQVLLQWTNNTETDFQGYSVFKANNLSDEFALVSKTMSKDSFLLDTLHTGMTSPYLYYYVIAYDNRLNASISHDTIKVARPDIIPPTSPLIRQYSITDSTVVFDLVPSSSEDVSYHVLYRTATASNQTDTLGYFKNRPLTYTDTSALPRTLYRYEYVAIDQAGLRNTDTVSVELELFDQGSLPPIRSMALSLEEKQLKLTWSYPKPVKQYIIYRANGPDEPLTEFKYLEGTCKEYIEAKLQTNTLYSYAIMAVFADGSNTRLSQKLEYQTPAEL